MEMNEETQTQPTTTTQDNDGGYKPDGVDKVERAEQAVKRLEEAEKRLDDKIAKLAELKTDRILGGTAGGHIETMMTEEQKKEAEAKAISDDIVKAFN